MSTLRQAAQQALEALENDAMQRTYAGGVRLSNAAIALRAALAECPHGADAACKECYDQAALELCAVCGWKTLIPGDACLNCERGKQALAEPEQEPVAWMHNHIEGNVIAHKPADIDRHPERWTALYPAPQPCPTCVALSRTVMMDQTSHDAAPVAHNPLTDEEIMAIGNASGLKAKMTTTGIIIHPEGAKRFARAIERAHGIKEQEHE